jgi:hypothetical protein
MVPNASWLSSDPFTVVWRVRDSQALHLAADKILLLAKSGLKKALLAANNCQSGANWVKNTTYSQIVTIRSIRGAWLSPPPCHGGDHEFKSRIDR